MAAPMERAPPPAETTHEAAEEPMGLPPLSPDHPPRLLGGAQDEFRLRPHNFLRGCKWAPDGSCVLSCSADNTLRLFNLPACPPPGQDLLQLELALRVHEGDIIYDFTWFPHMNSRDPQTCLMASSSRDNPVHLWDAFDGTLRGSFCAYNHLEVLCAPHSLCFTLDGSRLLGGFKGSVRIFPMERPGRGQEEHVLRYGSKRQGGPIGCLAMSPSQSVFACGSYGRSLGLYALGGGGALLFWPRLPAAPTQLLFSHDGLRLYVGGRKDTHILCWDLRLPDRPLLAMERHVTTNQRVTFDLDPTGRYLVSGDTRGFVSLWDTVGTPPEGTDLPLLSPVLRFRALQDCINGTSLHPQLPLLATSSGQRLFPPLWSSDEEEDEPPPGGDNRLQLWWWGHEPPEDNGWCMAMDSEQEDTHCHPMGGTDCDTDCQLIEDTHCHPTGGTGSDADCQLVEDTHCHPTGGTDCDADSHPMGDAHCHPMGGTDCDADCQHIEDTHCHPMGDTHCHPIEDDHCHPTEDTGTVSGDCHPPGDTDCDASIDYPMSSECDPAQGH
ncbi:telomerase Cajal body protein 1 isoform X2 [Melopsittacus undulatus]|uniref:telomerase Cajal body protein 1 isoform X2 n=1 Tax=Melopsittacus undulatus TaxID=13146 RepID=UPI00146C963E|nr:telomerase Cajal body protein 1 isoform X2 [Melopsittacus undulatus]